MSASSAFYKAVYNTGRAIEKGVATTIDFATGNSWLRKEGAEEFDFEDNIVHVAGGLVAGGIFSIVALLATDIPVSLLLTLAGPSVLGYTRAAYRVGKHDAHTEEIKAASQKSQRTAAPVMGNP